MRYAPITHHPSPSIRQYPTPDTPSVDNRIAPVLQYSYDESRRRTPDINRRKDNGNAEEGLHSDEPEGKGGSIPGLADEEGRAPDPIHGEEGRSLPDNQGNWRRE